LNTTVTISHLTLDKGNKIKHSLSVLLAIFFLRNMLDVHSKHGMCLTKSNDKYVNDLNIRPEYESESCTPKYFKKINDEKNVKKNFKRGKTLKI
jgi:hypothetical protein